MQRTTGWMLFLAIIIGLQLSACKPVASTASTYKPAQIEAIADTEFNRLILTDDAVIRLAIETAPVRQEEITRKRILGGKIQAMPGAESGDLSQVLIEVAINEADIDNLVIDAPGLVLPFLGDASGEQTTAQPVEILSTYGNEPKVTSLHYQVNNMEQHLIVGQRVRLEVPLEGDATEQTVIPYKAVIYDLQGNTWTYTNPAPLIFIRQPITFNYILGSMVVLTKGPAPGTQVVTAGASELYGIEFGVGK